MPIIFVNPAGSRKPRRKRRVARGNKDDRAALKKYASAKRARQAARRRAKQRRSAQIGAHRQPRAPSGFTWIQTGPGFNDGYYTKTRKSKMARKKKSKAHGPKRGHKGRFVKAKARKVKRRKAGARTRVARHMRRAYKHKTYPKRRKRRSATRMRVAKHMRRAYKHKTYRPRKKRRSHAATRMRVAQYMGAQKHATYPIANPARRRRRRKHSPGRHNPRRHRRMRHNPHRRYRRNPSVAGLMTLAKKAVPVLASMLGGKLLVKQVAARIPGVDKLGTFQGTALASGMLLLGSVLTDRIGGLKKFKDQIMLGLGLNVATELLSMTPLKGMLGLGEGIYDRALSDYVTTADYLTTGAMPIDDNIALSEYVTTGGLEEELGLSEELGVSEELGALDAATVRGGVSQMAMIKSIPGQQFAQDVPARTFTQGVSAAGPGYDNPGALYAGIFRGGF